MTEENNAIAWRIPGPFGKTPSVFLIYLMLFFGMGMFPSASYMPSLPNIQAHFGMSNAYAQLTITAFLITMGLGSMLFGPLAHKIGRRRTLILTCAGFVAGALLCLKAETSNQFIIGRLLQGLGATGLMTMGRTIIRDLFTTRQVKAISGYTIPTGPLALNIAPLAGGYLQAWYGWQGIFWFAALIYFAILLSILFHFPETSPKKEKTEKAKRPYRTLIKSPTFFLATTSAGLSMGFAMCYHTIAPILLLKHLSLSPIHVGWLGLVISPSVLKGMYLNHRLIDKLDTTGLLQLSSMLLLAASMLALIPALMQTLNTIVLVIPFMIGLTGAVLAFINGFSAAINPWPNLASFASALYNTWQCTVASLITLIAAWMPETSQLPMALLWLGIALMQSLLVFLLKRHQK